MSLLGDTWPFAIQGLIAPPSTPARLLCCVLYVQLCPAHESSLLVLSGKASASTKDLEGLLVGDW